MIPCKLQTEWQDGSGVADTGAQLMGLTVLRAGPGRNGRSARSHRHCREHPPWGLATCRRRGACRALPFGGGQGTTLWRPTAIGCAEPLQPPSRGGAWPASEDGRTIFDPRLLPRSMKYKGQDGRWSRNDVMAHGIMQGAWDPEQSIRSIIHLAVPVRHSRCIWPELSKNCST